MPTQRGRSRGLSSPLSTPTNGFSGLALVSYEALGSGYRELRRESAASRHLPAGADKWQKPSFNSIVSILEKLESRWAHIKLSPKGRQIETGGR